MASTQGNFATYDLFFRIGMWWRIFYGAMHAALGFALLNFLGTPVSNLFYRFMAHELVEDPGDLFVRIVGPALQHFSFTITGFLAVYFIFWGVIDVSLSIAMLKHKLWAFPIALTLIALFMIYEVGRLLHTHSFILGGVIVIDLVLLWLIKKEYDGLRPI